jgi:acyl-coenzyme A thioesterase PaaI-like protein
MGLALRNSVQPDGSVVATFPGNCALEGYSGVLDGGVIAALPDGAMTHCLFARRLPALTVELKVRYHESVQGAEVVFVRAWLEDDSHGLYPLRSELRQGGGTQSLGKRKVHDAP